MKVNQITETTAGSVASVSMPLGSVKKRTTENNKVVGLEPVQKVMTGKAKKKGPYQNSLVEGKMKELSLDLSSGRDGLNDVEFKKKYGKTKEEMRKSLQQKPKKVDEAELQEDDLIIVPGQGRKFKTGFVQHSQDRTDHEVEMALSDLFQAAKNAKTVYEIVKTYSEEQGLEGWVQEKIIKANDYLNTIREYLEHKQLTDEGTLGGVAGGVAGAMIGKTPSAALTGAQLGSELQDTFANESGAGVIAGGLQYEDYEVEPGAWTKAIDTLQQIFNAAKSKKEIQVQIQKSPIRLLSSEAKAIVDLYKIAKTKGREDEVIDLFTNLNNFNKLLKSNNFKQMVNKHLAKEQERPRNFDAERGAAYYDVISKETEPNRLKKSSLNIVAEKAVSKKQQRFMGMVHAAQKGEKPASAEVAKVAKSMPKKAAKDFAKTKHKGLPEKVKKDSK